jgi:hypothetical protein
MAFQLLDFALLRMGWPNTAAIAAIAMLPALVLTGHVGLPPWAPSHPARQAATSCPVTGQELALLPSS